MFRLILLVASVLASCEAWAAAQSLTDIYQEAVQNDPVLAAANSANLAAQEMIEQAKAAYRPSVSFSASAAANHTNIQLTGATPFRNGANNFQTYTATVNASQPIYRRENLKRIDQSEIHVNLSDKQYHLARQNLILRTTQAYFDVLLAQDQIGLLQAQKAAIHSQLDQAKASFEAGTVNVTDVNEAQARFDLIVAQLLSAENNLEIAKRSLQVITGKLPSHLASVKNPLNISSDLPSMQNWQDTALHNNLNIQIQQDQLNISDHDIEIARSGHYPSVDAVASYSDSDNTGSQYGYGYRLQNAAIGVQMSIPLYQGGAVDSKVRQAAYNRQKALDDLQTATRQATLETQRAYLDLNNSMAQIHALEQALASSQSQLDSTKLGHEVGVRTSVDVLNAQQQYFSANRDLLQARYQYLVNIIRLKTASGIVSEADLQDIDQQLAKR